MPASERLLNAVVSSCHWVVSRVTVAADRPAAEPRNCSSAGRKSPLDRPSNRLLRFWLEKGADLSLYTAADLARIAATLNRRPRPTLDLETPADRLNPLLSRAA